MTDADLAGVVAAMVGWMPETSRSYLAHRILSLLGLHLKSKDAILLERWQNSGGPQQFIELCQLTEPIPSQKPYMDVDSTPLSDFCNKWMSVTHFRDKETNETKPLTADMNNIRCLMVEELREQCR